MHYGEHPCEHMSEDNSVHITPAAVSTLGECRFEESMENRRVSITASTLVECKCIGSMRSP